MSIITFIGGKVKVLEKKLIGIIDLPHCLFDAQHNSYLDKEHSPHIQ